MLTKGRRLLPSSIEYSGVPRLVPSVTSTLSLTLEIKVPLLTIKYGLLHNSRWIGIPSVPYSDEVRNYAETTPYQLQAELDDASVVSEDPKYGCEAGCLYCGQPCVRSKFGHVFHQCPEHYRWWRMHKH